MKHLICKSCGSDLISTSSGLWECPKCGREYFVDDLSVKEVGNGDEKDYEDVYRRVDYDTSAGSIFPMKGNIILYYILSIMVPVAGIIFGIMLLRNPETKRAGKICLIIGMAIIGVQVLFFGVIALVSIFQ
jgi:predicted RNA-binding Zn-ribbon protein involved in translation (DUF1610 family)